jgi:hypothetical protein
MENKKRVEDELWQFISDVVDKAFSDVYNEDSPQVVKEKPVTPKKESAKTLDNLDPIYESISDYTNQTGKRFRMTKDQKTRGLTREEAFTETFGG